MGPALSLLLAALLAAPAGAPGAAARAGRSKPTASERKPGAHPAKQARRAKAARKAPTLAAAKAGLKALMVDRQKRRYRHHWEKAIRDLQRAAVGKDAPAATLEAARARYARLTD